jgi:hypothetical protein
MNKEKNSHRGVIGLFTRYQGLVIWMDYNHVEIHCAKFRTWYILNEIKKRYQYRCANLCSSTIKWDERTS